MPADPRRPGYVRLHWYTFPTAVARPPLGSTATPQAWAKAAQESLERSQARRRKRKRRLWRWLAAVVIIAVVLSLLSLLWLVKSWA